MPDEVRRASDLGHAEIAGSKPAPGTHPSSRRKSRPSGRGRCQERLVILSSLDPAIRRAVPKVRSTSPRPPGRVRPRGRQRPSGQPPSGGGLQCGRGRLHPRRRAGQNGRRATSRHGTERSSIHSTAGDRETLGHPGPGRGRVDRPDSPRGSNRWFHRSATVDTTSVADTGGVSVDVDPSSPPNTGVSESDGAHRCQVSVGDGTGRVSGGDDPDRTSDDEETDETFGHDGTDGDSYGGGRRSAPRPDEALDRVATVRRNIHIRLHLFK